GHLLDDLAVTDSREADGAERGTRGVRCLDVDSGEVESTGRSGGHGAEPRIRCRHSTVGLTVLAPAPSMTEPTSKATSRSRSASLLGERRGAVGLSALAHQRRQGIPSSDVTDSGHDVRRTEFPVSSPPLTEGQRRCTLRGRARSPPEGFRTLRAAASFAGGLVPAGVTRSWTGECVATTPCRTQNYSRRCRRAPPVRRRGGPRTTQSRPPARRW